MNKSLKSVSIEQLQNAIARVVSEELGVAYMAAIESIEFNQDQFAGISGGDEATIKLTLKPEKKRAEGFFDN